MPASSGASPDSLSVDATDKDILSSGADDKIGPDSIVIAPITMLWPIEAGRVFAMCVRRQRLAADLRALDPEAIESIIAALPRDLPPRVLRIERDREIRRLAGELMRKHQDRSIASSVRAMARLLTAAGWRAAGGGQRLSLIPEFSWIDGAEAADLVERVRDIIEFAPGRMDGRTPWPSRQQLVRIIGDQCKNG